jgi:hypothetical protein
MAKDAVNIIHNIMEATPNSDFEIIRLNYENLLSIKENFNFKREIIN